MVTIERVDEAGAQRLADETGRVVYLREHWSMDRPPSRCPQMTTDRDEAVSWGEFTAFVPQTFTVPENATGIAFGENPQEWTWQMRDGSESPMIESQPRREPWQPATAAHVDTHHLAGNLGELARRTVEEQQAGDRYESQRQYPRSRTADDPDHAFIAEPEPQLRVVRVLEYRGPQKWMEKTLANSWVSSTTPRSGSTGRSEQWDSSCWEVVEQIRTTERLCRWCGGEHLGACSEDECSGNPRKGRY